ncbi:hypothetical protein B0T14DRAFT_273875 [Immersiella caudata]|uniref:Uncharacterized protein n=1 Tax=Immersiella caudata TaxID=314043 RepID=A0AA40BXV2_9PEZI|nr:hypothetical protein B0T14DRAFT_273875 [Immersiella caudata]
MADNAPVQPELQSFDNEESLQVDEAAAQDFDDSDADSSLGTLSDSTASITSSILRYRMIHGRTYHSERGNAQYWGSNDEQQNEVLDIK